MSVTTEVATDIFCLSKSVLFPHFAEKEYGSNNYQNDRNNTEVETGFKDGSNGFATG